MRSGEHPRARGENSPGSPGSAGGGGTSPRTRGKPISTSAASGLAGNIPAHAGKTHRGRTKTCRREEHPRARGENNVFGRNLYVISGTSPRTRGKRNRWCRPGVFPRNIPAHAGKTDTRRLPGVAHEEHPRARGENQPSEATWKATSGTSPRTRGKQKNSHGHDFADWNIPAHAGKTLIDVRFLVPEGHFTFGFIFPHHGGVKFILS